MLQTNPLDGAEDATTPTLTRVLREGGTTQMAAAVQVQNREEDTTPTLLLHENGKTRILMNHRRGSVLRKNQTATHRRHEGQEEIQTLIFLQLEEEARVGQILTCLHQE